MTGHYSSESAATATRVAQSLEHVQYIYIYNTLVSNYDHSNIRLLFDID